MRKKIELIFDLYRYQINPVKSEQLSLFEKKISFEELKEKKNEIFADKVLKNFPKKITGKGEYIQKLHYIEENIFVYKFASKKEITHHNEKLEDETLEDFPFIYLIFNNDRDSQKIAISRN